jgi:hypothetical protein
MFAEKAWPGCNERIWKLKHFIYPIYSQKKMRNKKISQEKTLKRM